MVVGVVIGFAFIRQVVDFILGPTRRSLPAGATLIYTQPGEAFGLYIQIALIVGIMVAMPYIMFQMWRLVAPIMPPGATPIRLPVCDLHDARFRRRRGVSRTSSRFPT